jgi:hypothetical protein
MYSHVLDVHFDRKEKWLFFHYNQLLDGSALEPMRKTLEVKVDPYFAQKKLNRSISIGNIPRNCSKLYKKLCELANYSD